MKKYISITGLALALVLSFAVVGVAEEKAEDKGFPGEFSANVGFTNDYVWRGKSQTDNGMALQGGLDWSHESGFYLGIWGSNIDFNENDSASLEADLYAGYSGSVGDFSYDIQALYYTYPGADSDLDYDFFEGVLGLGYDFGFASLSGGFAYSPETFGDGGKTYYYNGGVSVPLPLPCELTLNGNIGRYEFDDAATALDYTHYDVGLSASVLGFDLGVSYTDTDLSSSECGGDNACDGEVLVSISRSF